MRCTEWFSGRGADEPGRSSTLVVLPTADIGERWSKRRLAPMIQETRAPMRPTVLAWQIWVLAIVVAIVLLLACSGCAAERYLTQEQDAELGRFCARPGGCAVVPGDEWRAIRELLEHLGIKPEDPV